jgi:curved DNA-binding protein
MEYVDYYAELGIPRDAPQDEIGPAFKKLARKYHPDVNKEAGAEDRFKRIVEAHEVLKDPESRKKYDRFGSAWNRVVACRKNIKPRTGIEYSLAVNLELARSWSAASHRSPSSSFSSW